MALSDQRTLFVFCFLNEAFFVCLYLNAFWTKPINAHFPIPESFLSSSLAISNPRFFGGIIYVLRKITWPQLVAIISAPICLGKQIINVVQFWKASKIVSSIAF